MTKVNLLGASGTTYKFDVHEIGTQFNSSAGVYVLMASSGSKYRVLYIGEAQSLSERLNQDPKHGNHDGYACAESKGLTHIATKIENGGKLARTNVESDLVNKYHPPCNK